ncbi:MAG TPA: hypothetical protein EYG57_12845 [Planctomycetes bacterium]|nr:hypothetical protein [Planctomycetota bacterium]
MFDAVVARLVSAGLVKRHGTRRIGLSDRGPRLSNNERKVYDQLVDCLRESGIESPFLPDLTERVKKNRQSVPSLLQIAVAQEEIVAVSNVYFVHADIDLEMRKRLRAAAENSPNGMTLSEIRNIMGTSRKFAVPYCEYLDRIGVTVRNGDTRQFAAYDAAET